MSCLRLAVVLVVALLARDVVHAQDLGSPLDQLSALRLDARDARTTAGFWLLGWGALSTVAGGVLAVSRHDQQALLAAGITTASFGAINALLSIGLFDVSGSRAQRILDDRERAGDYTVLREAELVAELHSGQFYAVNAGLDVAYIATGVLLYLLGAARARADTWEKGVGVAFISQSAFLLGFDIVNWANANARAARLRELRVN